MQSHVVINYNNLWITKDNRRQKLPIISIQINLVNRCIYMYVNICSLLIRNTKFLLHEEISQRILSQVFFLSHIPSLFLRISFKFPRRTTIFLLSFASLSFVVSPSFAPFCRCFFRLYSLACTRPQSNPAGSRSVDFRG